MKIPDPDQTYRRQKRCIRVYMAITAAAVVLVAALHAYGQEQAEPAPATTQEQPAETTEVSIEQADQQIVDLNALPPLAPLTEWQEPLPDDDDWSGPGMIVWQRADIEADRRAVDAIREQTQAIQAQTTALVGLTEAVNNIEVNVAVNPEAQEQTAANIAALTEAIQNIELNGTFIMPPTVAESVVPALDAIRNWIDPPAKEPAQDN